MLNQSSTGSMLVAALAMLASGYMTPAMAEWFPTYDDVLGWGTATCTQGGEVPRCFGLRCNGTLPHPGAEWFFFADDGAIPATSIAVEIKVDASLSQTISMLPMTAGGYLMHHSPVSLKDHWAFIKALQSGFGITVATESYPPFSLSLDGSRSEIERALNACAPVGQRPSEPAPTSCDSEHRKGLQEAERLAATPNGRLAAQGKRLDAEVRLNLCRQGIATKLTR